MNNKQNLIKGPKLWGSMEQMKLLKVGSLNELFDQIHQLKISIESIKQNNGNNTQTMKNYQSEVKNFTQYIHQVEKLLRLANIKDIKTITYLPIDVAELYIDIEAYVSVGYDNFLKDIDEIVYDFYLHPYEHLNNAYKFYEQYKKK